MYPNLNIHVYMYTCIHKTIFDEPFLMNLFFTDLWLIAELVCKHAPQLQTMSAKTSTTFPNLIFQVYIWSSVEWNSGEYKPELMTSCKLRRRGEVVLSAVFSNLLLMSESGVRLHFWTQLGQCFDWEFKTRTSAVLN